MQVSAAEQPIICHFFLSPGGDDRGFMSPNSVDSPEGLELYQGHYKHTSVLDFLNQYCQ